MIDYDTTRSEEESVWVSWRRTTDKLRVVGNGRTSNTTTSGCPLTAH